MVEVTQLPVTELLALLGGAQLLGEQVAAVVIAVRFDEATVEGGTVRLVQSIKLERAYPYTRSRKTVTTRKGSNLTLGQLMVHVAELIQEAVPIVFPPGQAEVPQLTKPFGKTHLEVQPATKSVAKQVVNAAATTVVGVTAGGDCLTGLAGGGAALLGGGLGEEVAASEF